jgi:hypothetical protein
MLENIVFITQVLSCHINFWVPMTPNAEIVTRPYDIPEWMSLIPGSAKPQF